MKPEADSETKEVIIDLPLLETALNSLAKALKVINFYPLEHPLRDEGVAAAIQQFKPLLKSGEVVLLWGKDGCTFGENGVVKSVSATAKSLAREMLLRKLQRLIIAPGLTIKDLKQFLVIVTTDPSEIYASGGIEEVMIKSKIRTIGANEVDLSLFGQDESDGECEGAGGSLATEEAGEGVEEGEGENPGELKQEEEEPLPLEFSVLGIDILIGMLKGEKRESQFLQLAREIIEAAEGIRLRGEFATLLPAAGGLLEVYSDPDRPSSQREFVRYALEQICGGEMTLFLLDILEERPAEQLPVLDALCGAIGGMLAYPLIQRLCVAESLGARKGIALSLSMTGAAALPALVSMLKDERWYVVRNMITILGEIHTEDSVRALQVTANHPEPKVRKEVVKSLVRVAPVGGEAVLVRLISDSDRDVVRQVIFSLGVLRSKMAVAPLLAIVNASDTFLKELDLKKLAIAALGRIGDKQVTESLLQILTTVGWLAPRRWTELKIAAAAALGQLGDENALPVLARLAKKRNPVGDACNDAAENLERILK